MVGQEYAYALDFLCHFLAFPFHFSAHLLPLFSLRGKTEHAP